MYSLDFPFAYDGPLGSADFRSTAQDFVVDEMLGFEPVGEGEHHYLHIKKTNTNTQWLARQLADFVGVKPMDVGYSGLKDRHAVTTQWFSVYLPKAPLVAWAEFFSQHDNIELLQLSKHSKKLKRGVHQSNTFELTLRNFTVGENVLTERLERIKHHGVPNYFGEQRFGIEGNNLTMAKAWLEEGRRLNKSQRGFAMSASRSYIFNLVLSARVKNDTWQSMIDGDTAIADAPIPTGPLWGRGRSAASGLALEQESAATEVVKAWLEGLEHCGLNQERRRFVLSPVDMSWEYHDAALTLKFGLPPGEFATAVLREIAALNNCAA